MTRLHRLLIPGALNPRGVLIASIVAMLMVFVVDLFAGADIRLHMLYIFPMGAIALHCEKKRWAAAALGLSVTFQLVRFTLHGIPVAAFSTDASIAVASAILTIVLARALRENYLMTVKLATTDPLTTLHNRRSFESIADREIAKLARYGGTFSLAIIDLDNFKVVNDSEGHIAGDKALKLTSAILLEHTRHSDIVARLGGDEFAILMPNTKEEDCGLACRHLAEMIAKRMAGAGFGITASIGYASYEQAPESISHVFQKADKAMYAAKASGKRHAAIGNGWPL